MFQSSIGYVFKIAVDNQGKVSLRAFARGIVNESQAAQYVQTIGLKNTYKSFVELRYRHILGIFLGIFDRHINIGKIENSFVENS